MVNSPAKSRKLLGTAIRPIGLSYRCNWQGLNPWVGRGAMESNLWDGTMDATSRTNVAYSGTNGWPSGPFMEMGGMRSVRGQREGGFRVPGAERRIEEGALLALVLHAGRTGQSPRHSLLGGCRHALDTRRGRTCADTASLGSFFT